MVENPIAGQFYWCVEPSVESVNCGDYNAVPPWRGLLVSHKTKAVQYLELVATDDNDVPDYDPNAKAIVDPSDLFPTQEAARVAYVAALTEQIAAATQVIDGWDEEIKRLQVNGRHA